MIKIILDIGAVLIPIMVIGLAIENYILRRNIQKIERQINENKKKDL